MFKFKQNLSVIGNEIHSYRTHVANIDYPNKTVEKLGYWSQTTSKHIIHVANVLGFTLIGVK